ncbi:2,3-bisphosphoglycerate-independent phosphoglycerate mutase [Lentzea sp. NPDC004789]
MSSGILLVLDGWGHAPAAEDNAITTAETPVLDELISTCPSLLADASGTAVGLLPGTVGNSEIGHMVIGAGRPVPYDSVLVQQQIDSGEFASNPLLCEVFGELASTGAALHLIGLASDGAIHAHVDHLRPILLAAAEQGVGQVWLHAITDGRDVSDGTAADYLGKIEKFGAEAGVGTLVTVVGRGYALDKSGNLDLTREAGLAIADGAGTPVTRLLDAVEASDRGDEWVAPSVLTDDGVPVGRIAEGDAVLFTNFRSDRIQQLADFLVGHLAGRSVRTVSLAQYDTVAEIPPLVGRAETGGGLADVLQEHGLRSVRIAETEKFEHVTYYVNGRDSAVRDGEEHVKVTAETKPDYRARPEMTLGKVVGEIEAAARRSDVDLVVANLANIDVVGHTGDFDATVLATAHTDRAVARIVEVARETSRWVLLVGDHGNAEQMKKNGPDGTPRPYGGHTTNPVPVVLVPAPGQEVASGEHDSVSLADIAPTVLGLLGRPPGEVMTGKRLW